jgi:MerR family transcriptional regulator, Zn(II)-responsive regulator of zntA
LTLEAIPGFILCVVKRSSKRHFLRSSELAKLAGVSTDTLRHYERVGVLSSRRSANGYREYSPDATERLRLVRSALAVGFTLTELASIFEVRNRGGAPCRQVRELAAEKLAHMDEQLRDITAVRNRLRALIKDWDLRLQKTTSGEPARLLETLAPANIIHRSLPARRFGQKNEINERKR